jgi:uncharacterized membrane protein YcaP (DUF421 family)
MGAPTRARPASGPRGPFLEESERSPMPTPPIFSIPLDWFYPALNAALGLDLESSQLGIGQVVLRAVVVFIGACFMMRFGNKRFMGKSSALDVILGVVFGSVISRAISGTAPFFPTLAGGFTLILLHRVLAAFAFHSHRFGSFVKGTPQLLVKEGQIQWAAMSREHITAHDLEEALRRHGKSPDLCQVRTAHLERNGDISLLF